MSRFIIESFGFDLFSTTLVLLNPNVRILRSNQTRNKCGLWGRIDQQQFALSC